MGLVALQEGLVARMVRRLEGLKVRSMEGRMEPRPVGLKEH